MEITRVDKNQGKNANTLRKSTEIINLKFTCTNYSISYSSDFRWKIILDGILTNELVKVVQMDLSCKFLECSNANMITCSPTLVMEGQSINS